MAELLSRSSIAGNKHLTIMSGMWADFIRLDLATENITGKKLNFLRYTIQVHLIIEHNILICIYKI